MPKLKTHKGNKKVVNQRPSGTITTGRAGSRHKTGKKSTDINRSNRKGSTLSNSDLKRIKSII